MNTFTFNEPELEMPTRAWWNRMKNEIHEAWNVDLDAEKAVFLGFQVIDALRDETDVEVAVPAIKVAIEPLWDASSTRSTRAARDLAGEFRVLAVNAARFLPQDRARALVVEANIQSARAWHRADVPNQAAGHIGEARRAQSVAVGGPEELRRAIGQDPHGALAQENTALLAIALPVHRVLAKSGWTTHIQWRDAFLREAMTIVSAEPLPPHERMHALVSQTFYGLAERGNPSHRDLVERLAVLDALLRPPYARAQATRPLIEMSAAHFAGDEAKERQMALTARAQLHAGHLTRHIDALSRRRWWPLSDAA